jgi:hypothetical protein
LYAAISMGVRSKMPLPPVLEGAAKFPVNEVATKKADRLAKRSEGGPTSAAGCRQSGTVTEAQEQSGAIRRKMRRASADPAS